VAGWVPQDVMCVMKEIKYSMFIRETDDYIMQKTIGSTDRLFGIERTVQEIDGRAVSIVHVEF
jgi:DnaJ-class molecular chaperone